MKRLIVCASVRAFVRTVCLLMEVGGHPLAGGSYSMPELSPAGFNPCTARHRFRGHHPGFIKRKPSISQA
jgi:hypothetical protein